MALSVATAFPTATYTPSYQRWPTYNSTRVTFMKSHCANMKMGQDMKSPCCKKHLVSHCSNMKRDQNMKSPCYKLLKEGSRIWLRTAPI